MIRVKIQHLGARVKLNILGPGKNSITWGNKIKNLITWGTRVKFNIWRPDKKSTFGDQANSTSWGIRIKIRHLGGLG
jgi:hypothetical protein